MKHILTILSMVGVLALTSCAPVTSPTPAEEATIIYSDTFVTLYHLTYRGHEVIVSSQGGVVELTSNPFDTYKEGGK